MVALRPVHPCVYLCLELNVRPCHVANFARQVTATSRLDFHAAVAAPDGNVVEQNIRHLPCTKQHGNIRSNLRASCRAAWITQQQQQQQQQQQRH
eukprot:COSAG02_NODE_41691_length_392_cov_0.525597_1_plen_94_part_01